MTSTLQLISTYYDAFNRQAWGEMLACLSENVVHDINQSTAEVGLTAFAAFLDRMDTSYAEQVEKLVIMATPDGQRASAEFFIRGKYHQADPGLPEARGQEYYLRVGAFFEVENGRIARVTNYYNLSDWIRQVS